MKTLELYNRKITTDLPAFVMGIVNATPDSFYVGSRFSSLDMVRKQIDQGADIIDIGGESTRPGSLYVSPEEEIRRVVPLVESIRSFSDIPISIDTRKLAVMKAAFEAGADILNDVSALEDDCNLASFCGDYGLNVILMHKKGTPVDMQEKPQYGCVFQEVSQYLERRCAYAQSQGIRSDRIMVDPGIGFGKNLEDNLALMKDCGALCGGRYPVLMALSRKSSIGQLTGRSDPCERLVGTVSADLLCVQRGAFMVRVHDVAEAVDSLKILSAFQ